MLRVHFGVLFVFLGSAVISLVNPEFTLPELNHILPMKYAKCYPQNYLDATFLSEYGL